MKGDLITLERKVAACIDADPSLLQRVNGKEFSDPVAAFIVNGHRESGDFNSGAEAPEEFFPEIHDCVLPIEEDARDEIETAIIHLKELDPASVFTDLAAILSGGLQPEKPTIGKIANGNYLFYPGRLNENHAEPSVGKTNVNLAASKGVIESGGTVIFLDPEDTPTAIVSRLLSFGTDPEAIAKRFLYVHNPEIKDILKAIEWAKSNPVTLVVVDGLAELLAAQGVSEDSPTEVLPFFRNYLRPFAEAGAGVLVSDHVVKSSENRGRWQRGTGAKMGRYDGAVYELRLAEAYSPDKAGRVKLIVCKDRNGGVGPVGTVAAEMLFTPNETGTTVRILPKDDSPFVPTALMQKVSMAIEADPDISYRSLRSLGKGEYVDQAIGILSDMGSLRVTKPGAGMKNKYEILDPYRNGN